MKKIIPLFLLSFISFFVTSCDNNDNDPVPVQNNGAVAQMKDITGTFSSSGGYTISQGLSILNTDVVLVYRNINSNTSSSAIWQLLPKTFFLSNGRELDYNFIFNSQNVDISTQANFDQATMTSAEANKYLINQNFRIVLVPADPAGKGAKVDYNDYNSVIKYYNIDESKVVKTKVN